MKRQLSEQELELIINCIQPNPYIPHDTAIAVYNKKREELREQLIGIEIYPECIDELASEVKNAYISSLIEPGESVGIICAKV